MATGNNYKQVFFRLMTKLSEDPAFSTYFTSEKSLSIQSTPDPSPVDESYYPVAMFSYKTNDKATWAGIESGKIYVVIKSKEPSTIEDIGDFVESTLHTFRYADDNLTIYRCFAVEGRTSPVAGPNNTWETLVSFDIQFG
jgi:hypothetical protein